MTSSSLTKPHFALLDGLRGVAALIVLTYHLFEAWTTSAFDQMCNHGHLAVDFFFVLSGFVVAYAYDDRRRCTPEDTHIPPERFWPDDRAG